MALLRKRQVSAGKQTLVVGLGNPGGEYAATRHNAGFLVAESLVRRHGLPRPRRRYGGRWTEGDIDGRPVAVLMPQTFMNRSGDSVAEAGSKKHIPPGRIIVVHDDMDFPFGVVRCRVDGGEGGHNGLSSISFRLGTREYIRVRFGIGRPDDNFPASRDWVLSDFKQTEEQLQGAVDVAADCVEAILREGIEPAMNAFNRREP